MQTKLVLVAGLLALSTAARANVIWRGDYETNDLSQWASIEGITSRFTMVTSPVRQGKYALRLELRQGDFINGGDRNEVDAPETCTEGMERYYAWSTMFDLTYPSNPSWQVFTQWHHSGFTLSPPLEMDIHGEVISIGSAAPVGNDTIPLWQAPLVRGVWHDFVVHVMWSADATVGFVELWYDGKLGLELRHHQTLYAGQTAYMKQGLYRDSTISPTAIVYHDGMVVGTTLADVAPQLIAPPPPPPPVADAGTPPPTADAGTPPPVADAGTPPPVADAGTPAPPADAGTPVADAGSPTPIADAGTTPDADAGISNSAQPPATYADAGSPSVAAASAGYPQGGCSSTGGTAAMSAFLIAGLALIGLRRKKR